jgi:menaquinone-dependent protoporphyrinogen oxidase
MTSVLIAYASTHGQTERIAHRLRDVLLESGLDAELQRLTSGSSPGPAEADAVLVGASIHGSHHQPEVVDWLRAHRTTLSRMPTGLFSVSLAAADHDAEGRVTAQEYVDELLEDTGFFPRVTRCFAGALQYREYGPMMRLVMRLIAHHHDLPTDVHHDVDFTDWEAVDAFGREFAARPAPAATT